MSKVAVKTDTGAVVWISEVAGAGSLDGLQRTLDDELKGNFGSSPFIDRDAAERARERAVAAAGGPGRKLFVTDATPEEIREFEKRLHRVN